MTTFAEELADAASSKMDRWSTWRTGPDGAEYRANIEYDQDGDLFRFGSFGKVAEPSRHSRQRPDGFDGAAVKIRSRSGMLWWQPPEDVKGDAQGLASIRERVEGYFLEHWWFVGVRLERRSAPCPHCGERKTTDASLWGIESDAGDYFAEVIADLIHELQPEVTV